MRIPHFLRAPKRGAQPSLCLFLDTETRPVIDERGRQLHRLEFGWCCYTNQYEPDVWSQPQWQRFTTVEEFWNVAMDYCQKGKVLYLFSHNGAFDLPVLRAFTELPARGFQLCKAVVDAPPIILRWRSEEATVVFIDTLNIWRMPLAKVGKSYGVPKLPMPAPEASREEWDRYGKNDVEIIRVAVQRWLAFLRQHDLGPFAHTLASQAMKTFKYKFMQHEIFIDCNEKATALSRAAYVGGRTECFHIGVLEGPLYYLDINSMYPAVMQANDFPTKCRAHYTQPEADEIESWRKKYLLVVDCDIDTDQADYPVNQDEKLTYPIGRFRTVLAGPEFLHAWDKGRVRKMHAAALYEGAPIFRTFVDTLYKLRLDARHLGNEVDDFNLKILANSLYGKFGQRGRRFEECGRTDPDAVWVHTELDLDSGQTVRYRAFGGLVQAWIDDAESSESFPAIAAFVTSYARLLLLRAIEDCGRENVFYCDTDSIVTNGEGILRMKQWLDPVRLGALKTVKVIKRFEIRGPKDYTMDEETKIKGIRQMAVQVAHNTYEQDKFVGFRGLLQEGQLAAPIVHKVRKKLRRVYTKGTVLPSGKVLPLRRRARKTGGRGRGKG